MLPNTQHHLGFFLMSILAIPSWHTLLFSIIGGAFLLAIGIIGFFTAKWMTGREEQHEKDIDNVYKMHKEDMANMHLQRSEDLTSIEKIRLEDNKLMRDTMERLADSIGLLSEETKKKAISDAKFEQQVLFQVKDFQEKMLKLAVDVSAHTRCIDDINRKIKNIERNYNKNIPKN